MGKAEDGHPLPSTAFDAQGTTPNAGNTNGCCFSCIRLKKLLNFRCVLALVLGAAVLLSAIFWLPFFHFGDDHKDLDLEDYAGHDIVACFRLKKPASFLKDYILKLEDDIFEEMSFSSTKVNILSLESEAGSNITKVVFAVESDLTTRSLIRASFVSLITNQSFLHLTASLFGDPFSFDVLKFRGGITASPVQKAFLMQNVQIVFNFTLNFSIDEILNNFDELTSQLKTGLRLAPYENLYIKLMNRKGSTVAPPTTIESQVLLAVGINPSKSRFKQLAQTITHAHTKNLGLNNTVFGRVKQVRLSSILPHAGPSPSPSPSPSRTPSTSPSPISKVHHNFHHQHHHDANLSPSLSPSPSTVIGKGSPVSTPAPAPRKKNKAAEPPACNFGHGNWFPWKHKHPQTAPSAPPVYAPHSVSLPPKQIDHRTPKISPVRAESPLPNVAHAHSQLPPKGDYHAWPPDVMSLVSPYPSPSSAESISSHLWALPLFILLALHF